ncbi:MAG: GNAT family N-acetyltransferase [Phycisphaerales bacterium]|nr:GNAT family N-acetyltransferase [Phycisphaerales bacterium]
METSPWSNHTPPRLSITQGGLDDYRALAHQHYRAAAPATIALILAARLGNALAGVLVVSMPTLNATWRDAVFPALRGMACAGRARWINQNIRVISRVIVDPAQRGTGIATALVRAYLARPLTRHTEAIAAMARWSPFFRHAGMRELVTPACKRDARLARELRALGVVAWRLSDARLARRAVRIAAVKRAIERWARASKATRGLEGPAWQLAVLAAQRITAPPRVFVHDSRGKSNTEGK